MKDIKYIRPILRNVNDNTSVEVLKFFLHYDPITGVFTYVRDNGPKLKYKAGDVAGKIYKSGYRFIPINGNCETASRLAWLYMIGEYPADGFIVDHKDTIRSNDAWSNLRLATHPQNCLNSSNANSTNTGVKGVSAFRCGGGPIRYQAQLFVKQKTVFCKSFKTLAEAADAIKEAREKYHGEFANHG